MPAILAQHSVAANETSENVLEGSNFEFIEEDSIVMLSAVVPTVANAANLQCTFLLGGAALLTPPFGTIFVAPALTVPNDVEHNLVRVGGSARERLFMTFQNNTGNAVVVRYSLRIDPV